jgi:hypothetical protein
LNRINKKNYFNDPVFFWFAAAFLILFIASKSLGLSLGYALDDYATLLAPSGGMHAFYLSQGRFTFALIQIGIDFAGLKQPELTGLGFFLSAGGLLLVSWMALSGWLQNRRLLAAAVGALLGAHPFFTEYVSFHQSMFPTGICFLVIAGAIFLLVDEAPFSIGRLCAAAGIAAVASGINQIAMAYFCIAALGISLQQKATLPPLRKAFLAVRDTFLAGALASLFYLAMFAISMRLATVDPNARMKTLAVSELGGRIHDVAVLLMNIFGGRHPLVGSLAAICIALVVLAFGFRASAKADQWGYVWIGALVFVLGVGLSLAPAAISGVWWPMPRTLIAMPLAIALGICILSFGASRIQVQVATVALFIAAAVFAGKSGSLLVNQQRLNRWDMGLAREIVLKVAEGRQIDASTPIVIHRATWAYEVDKAMPIGDANTSAVNVGWSVDALFEEASGRKVQVTLGAETDKTCDNAPRFPTAGSIRVVDGATHVCL